MSRFGSLIRGSLFPKEPDYTSTNIISTGMELDEAISALDNAISTSAHDSLLGILGSGTYHLSQTLHDAIEDGYAADAGDFATQPWVTAQLNSTKRKIASGFINTSGESSDFTAYITYNAGSGGGRSAGTTTPAGSWFGDSGGYSTSPEYPMIIISPTGALHTDNENHKLTIDITGRGPSEFTLDIDFLRTDPLAGIHWMIIEY